MFSVVISVKNEERNIRRCLEALKGCTEILVVDSGSTDATATLAESLGAKVVQFQWNGQFPKKRNWVLRNLKLSNPWVLFLDADEVVSPAFLREVEAALASTAHAGFWLRFDNYFLGHRLRHGDAFRKLALIKVGAGEYERIEDEHWSKLDMEVHEHPILNGTIGEIATPIEHNDFKGLHAYIHRHNEYSTWEARRYLALTSDAGFRWETLTERQRRKYRNLARWWLAPAYFLAAYFLKRGFLDGAPGFLLAVHKMIYFFQIRLKILELQRARGN